jgi:Flp pilus assembly protein TadG
MRCNHRQNRRWGAHVVECAFVYPLLFLLLIGLVVGGAGVHRYQQVAHLAREAARFASVHAGQYLQENAAFIQKGTLPNVNDAYITTNLVNANAAGMDTSQLKTSISFNMSSGSYDWDNTAQNGDRWPYSLKTIGDTTYSETNTVSVTVSYVWWPEAYFVGPITLTSTSVMPVCY